MGRTLLILMAGFAVSFGLLAMGKNRRFVDSVDRMVDQFSSTHSKNAATSGAYMALSQLYQNKAWRAGYNNLAIAGDTLNVTVVDNSTDTTLGLYRVKINSNGRNGTTNTLSQVVAFDREFHEFAVWAKDTVISITAKDSLGGVAPNLIIHNAPFMPKIDKDSLEAIASYQSQWHSGNFTPSDNYPANGDFISPDSTTPNVTYVGGNLKVKSGRTVYGIFVVGGDVDLEGGSTMNGILYSFTSGASIGHSGSDLSQSLVKGGVVTWGNVNGTGGDIVVQHFPSYIHKFVTNYAPDNPPMRVLSWK